LQRNYVLLGSQEYLDSFAAAEAKIFPSIEKTKELTIGNDSQQMKLKLVEDIAKYRLNIWHETIDVYKKSGFDAARKHIEDTYKVSGMAKMGELRKTLSDITAEEEEWLVVHEQQNERDFTNSRNCIYAAFVVSMSIFLFPLINLLRKQL
jgi:CHASE3 domain sensor protein